MGLDMYMYAERSVYRNFGSKDNVMIEESVKNIVPIPWNTKHDVELRGIRFEVAYWRKANEIHNWFVTNVQDGVDDCERHHVEREQLAELVDACKKVLDNKELAPSLLPTKSGFFFGGTEYDEYYFKSLELTVEMLEPLLAEKADPGYDWDFTYRSSW